jgi:hypothetical protein
MHQFPRYPALAADFFGNRVRAQTLYQTLPDPGAGAVANKHPTGWNMEKREPVLVNRCTDFGRHSPASVCFRELPENRRRSPPTKLAISCVLIPATKIPSLRPQIKAIVASFALPKYQWLDPPVFRGACLPGRRGVLSREVGLRPAAWSGYRIDPGGRGRVEIGV